MRADDKRAMDALKKLGEGWAVIYIEHSGPYGLTAAGEIEGRPFYMAGTPHWIEPSLEATVTPVGIEYRRAGDPDLVYYVTPVEEAPDAPDDEVRRIREIRQALAHWPSPTEAASFLLGVGEYTAGLE